MSSKKNKDQKIKSNKLVIHEEFPTNWNIDAYRVEYESEEHWQLRRKFMEAHKQKFPEDKLVCLAQVFFNMELMGCKYPADTMLLVGELAKDVAKEFREKRANKLKRTFVSASSAAENRAKGKFSTRQNSQQKLDKNDIVKVNNNRDVIEQQRKCFNLDGEKTQIDIFNNLPYGKFVLYFVGGRNCIRTSAQRCNVTFEEKDVTEQGNPKTIAIYLDSKLVITASEENMKLSKNVAFQKSLQILQKNCYTIKPNPLRDTIEINRKENGKIVCSTKKLQEACVNDTKLNSSNKGFQMMKSMGWTGGGLGSKSQGRSEPVLYLLNVNRIGLGNNTSELDKSQFDQILQNYVNSNDIRDLEFEPTFLKEERAIIHQIAGKFNLKSTSRGKDESRSLVISKKNITNEMILKEILVYNNAKYIDQYLIQVPECKSSLYPDYTTELKLDL